MLHALSVLLSASLLAGVFLVIVETLLRDQARIVAALRMVRQPERSTVTRIRPVRYVASPRPVRCPATVYSPVRLHEAA